MGYPFCDSDCPSIVTSPRHVARPSVFAFSYAPDNVCQTTLFSDPFCTLSILEGDSYHDSIAWIDLIYIYIYICYGQNSAMLYKLYFWPLNITEFKTIKSGETESNLLDKVVTLVA